MMQQLQSLRTMRTQVEGSHVNFDLTKPYDAGIQASIQQTILGVEDAYALPVRDRGLTLPNILRDPLTHMGNPTVAQHLITLAQSGGVVDKTDPVVMALHDAKSYLEMRRYE